MDIGNLSSVYGDVYSSMANKNASKLEEQLGADYSKATDEELMEVCKQFETYFMEQVMKEMVKTIPKNEETAGSMSTMMDYYQDEMIHNFADTSTEHSGLGLAQMLYEQMKQNYGLTAGGDEMTEQV